MHADIEVPARPDDRWADRPLMTFRSRRPHKWAVDVVKHSGMPLDTCALYILLVDLPEKWELRQAWVVSQGYAAEKRVRRMFNDMIGSGRMRMARRRGPDGKLIPGIYELSDEPIWLDERLFGAVDNSLAPHGSDTAETASLADGKAPERRGPDRRVVIDNSIVHPDTDTGPADVESPVSGPPRQADGRDRGRKSHLTGKSERRVGGAKSCLPQTEPRQGAANGSPVKRRASGEGDRTSTDRYIEQRLDQMVAVASIPGSRMPDPRRAARSVASLIQWQAEGLDFALDVLPTIADVCSRAADPDRRIVSWHYFTGAIRDRHARRIGQASTPPASKRQLDGWTPAGSAFGRRR